MTVVTHLTERSYRLLLQGSLPPAEARLLARHLEEACDVCEELLASLPDADAADGLADEALGALVPAGGRGSDLEFARIERRLREVGAPARRTWHLVPAALAAAVLAAGLAGLLLPKAAPPPAWDGVKGARVRLVPVRLGFAVVAPSPAGPPALERGVRGQEVAAAASLQFEIEAARAAHVALLRVGAGEAPELVWGERVGSGRWPVALSGRAAVYPLAELAGPQRFVLFASERPLDVAGITRAAAALAPPARVRAELDGLSVDVVEVEVRAGAADSRPAAR